MLVPISESGKRVGQYHHRAIISDEVVERLRTLHEDRKQSYGQLSVRFGIPYQTVKKICRYERRATRAAQWVWSGKIERRN